MLAYISKENLKCNTKIYKFKNKKIKQTGKIIVHNIWKSQYHTNHNCGTWAKSKKFRKKTAAAANTDQ
jgi:heme-degrading monooxygenase HmoA